MPDTCTGHRVGQRHDGTVETVPGSRADGRWRDAGLLILAGAQMNREPCTGGQCDHRRDAHSRPARASSGPPPPRWDPASSRWMEAALAVGEPPSRGYGDGDALAAAMRSSMMTVAGDCSAGWILIEARPAEVANDFAGLGLAAAHRAFDARRSRLLSEGGRRDRADCCQPRKNFRYQDRSGYIEGRSSWFDQVCCRGIDWLRMRHLPR